MPLKNPAVVQQAKVRQYGLASGQTFKEGAVVLLDVNEDVVEGGANPTGILGICLHDANVEPYEGKALVALAEADSRFWMYGTRAPIKDDIGKAFGIVRNADGYWVVNLTDTTNTRVRVHDVDTATGRYLVNFLAANRALG
jgi:hypothetical protein